MGDVLAHRQGELARAVAERLDATSHRLNESMGAAARKRVVTRYSWGAHLSALEKLLDAAPETAAQPHPKAS